MNNFNFRTPPGVKESGQNTEFIFEYSPNTGRYYSYNFTQAQRVVDSEVLRYCSPYVPFDTGQLNQSGTRSTVIGSGEVVYSTPYARRLYYNPQYNFQGGPMRGAYFFQRMVVDHGEDIRRTAGKVAAGE